MNRSLHSVLAKYHPLLQSMEDRVIRFLEEALEVMFAKVEPVMIDFASKAESDNAQTAFFDAITQIREKQKIVTWDLIHIVKDGFAQCLQGRPIYYPKPIIETDSEEQLGIVDDKDLEVHISVESMITRARNNSHQDLYQLRQRLAIMRQGKKPEEHDIPGSPAHLATAFQSVSSHFELEQKLLLIVYMMFDRHVMAVTDQLYRDLNGLLSDAGIYPNLAPILNLNRYKGSAAREGRRGHQETRRAGGQETAGRGPLTNQDFADGQQVFNAILSLLTEQRRLDPRFSHHPELIPGGDLSKLKDKHEMVDSLKRIQIPDQIDLSAYESATADELPPLARKARITASLKQRILDEREQVYSKLDPNTIPVADLDTIELVGMLFEHILDDEDLQSLTKTLICHLHTPYLKVAVVDRNFLVNTDHIARRFLNLVVDAGRRWVDQNNLQAGVYGTLQQMIQDIMRNSSDDLALYERYFESLYKEIQSLEHKTRILEARTKEATRGKDRLEFARQHAEEVLVGLCEGIRFFPQIESFLHSLWKNYMILLLLRDADIEQQEEWRGVIHVIRGLIVINNQHHNSEQHKAIRDQMPDLKGYIESGLEFLGNRKAAQYRDLLKLIERLQNGELTPELSATQTKTMTAQYTSRSESTRRPQLSHAEKQILKKIKSIKIGSWFEFQEADGEYRRVKLSWYSPITNNHMFIDRFGQKAFIMPTRELIRQFMSKKVRTVAPNRFPFVDHALEKIYRLLGPA